jgi:hypothetical protein
VSNATLAARISALVDKWNGYKNALRDLLTKKTGTVDMEDGTGAIVTLPTFPALQASVNILTDSLTGAVSQAQNINAQTVIYMNAADASAKASDIARAASVVAKDASAASASASSGSAASSAAQIPLAAAQVKLATDQVSLAKDQVTLATTKATAAGTSATAAAGSATTAGTKADTATTQAGVATTQAGNASASATAAATSQTLSLNYANAAVNVEVTPGVFSARHWAEQARLNVLGSLVFKGRFDASKGTFPVSPGLGDFYIVSVTGTIGAVKFTSGDMLFYDGSGWDRIDNQSTVSSVAGRTGNVVIAISDLAGLQGALDAKQNNLGFTPLQQGGGTGQSTNKIYIGWGSSKLKVTIDATDFGNIALESWVNTATLLRGVSNNSAGTIFASGNPPNIAAISGAGGDRTTSLQISNASNTTASATMSFIREGQCGVHFGLDTDNVVKIGGWSFGSAYRVIHEGLTNWYCPGQLGAGQFLPNSSAGAYINGNGSGMQFNGQSYYTLAPVILWNNSGGWARVPRTFVQSGDPGAAAGEGDLWFW